MSADLPERPRRPHLDRRSWRRRFAWRRRPAVHSPIPTMRRGRSPRRHWPRRVLIGSVALVVLIVLGLVGVFIYARLEFDRLHRAHVSGLARIGSNKPFDILLVGSDSRAFVDSSGEAAKFGTSASVGGQRSDVIIVARIDPTTRAVRLLSIPRDTYVDIPGNVKGISGPNRVNVAFNNGPSLLVETVTRSFHVPISYYVSVNFAGFQGIVNALGGIHLDFRYPVRDSYSGLDITSTGCELVHGAQALALVRSRHLYYFKDGSWRADEGSDWSRIQRQDAFFRAVISASKGVLTNPIALNNVVSAAASDFTIDQTLSESKVLYLVQLFRGFTESELATETLPTVPYTTKSGADVLAPAPGPDEKVITSFLAFGASSSGTALGGGVRGNSVGRVTSAGSTTVTTLPGSPRATPANVVYNTQPEPWNPTPC